MRYSPCCCFDPRVVLQLTSTASDDIVMVTDVMAEQKEYPQASLRHSNTVSFALTASSTMRCKGEEGRRSEKCQAYSPTPRGFLAGHTFAQTCRTLIAFRSSCSSIASLSLLGCQRCIASYRHFRYCSHSSLSIYTPSTVQRSCRIPYPRPRRKE